MATATIERAMSAVRGWATELRCHDQRWVWIFRALPPGLSFATQISITDNVYLALYGKYVGKDAVMADVEAQAKAMYQALHALNNRIGRAWDGHPDDDSGAELGRNSFRVMAAAASEAELRSAAEPQPAAEVEFPPLDVPEPAPANEA